MKQPMPRSLTGYRKGAPIERRLNATLFRQLESFTNNSNYLDHLRRLNEKTAHVDESNEGFDPPNML